MSNKKIFFRNDKYTYMEMMKRTPPNILSENVLGEKKLTQAKVIKLFLERVKQFPDLEDKLKDSFDNYGRKGDVVNVQIYDFHNFKYSFLDDKGIDIIRNLKNKKVNSLGFLSSFTNEHVCYIDDMCIVKDKYIDYKFKFEYDSIEEREGKIVDIKKNNYVECRHYIKDKILVVMDSTAFEVKAVVNMVFVLPYYINNIKGNETLYSKPNFNQILLNSTQLESIKVLLGGTLKYTVLSMNGDKGVKVKIEGNDEEFEKKSSTLKNTIKNGDNKEVQFYWKDTENKNNKIAIKSNCQIISTNFLSIQSLESIINNILLVYNKGQFFIPIRKIVEQYCNNEIRKSLAKRYVESIIKSVISELKSLVGQISKEYSMEIKPSELYSAISLNIIIQASINKKQNKYVKNKFEICKFEELHKVTKYYLKSKHDKNITECEMNSAVQLLGECVKSAGKEESKLLDAYYSAFSE